MEETVSYLKKRGVEYLVHFTPISNLIGIMEKGIVPRSVLDETEDYDYRVLDQKRLEGRPDFSCFSISFPNYLMMYRYRKILNEEKRDVALLLISVDTLLSFTPDKVLFYPTNAASREWKNTDCTARMGLAALKSLFDKEATTKTGEIFNREDAELPDYLTTNPQSEVQIKGVIPWKDIKRVVVDGKKKQEILKKKITDKPVHSMWKLNHNEQLDFFGFPQMWEPWKKKAEVNDGKTTSI